MGVLDLDDEVGEQEGDARGHEELVVDEGGEGLEEFAGEAALGGSGGEEEGEEGEGDGRRGVEDDGGEHCCGFGGEG